LLELRLKDTALELEVLGIVPRILDEVQPKVHSPLMVAYHEADREMSLCDALGPRVHSSETHS
jgi:hypothetical protein